MNKLTKGMERSFKNMMLGIFIIPSLIFFLISLAFIFVFIIIPSIIVYGLYSLGREIIKKVTGA
ncbi:hypothetical protein KKG81_07365 [bacterium]|nr:hypothetical protein [bacterium]